MQMHRSIPTAPHPASWSSPVGDGPTVDVVLIGTDELRLRLTGAFVTSTLGPAVERLSALGALGFGLVEIDATGISTVDALGHVVLEDFLRRIGAAGSRLEASDPGHHLTPRRVA